MEEELKEQIESLKAKCTEVKKEKDDLQLEVKTKKDALAHLKSIMKET